MSKRQLKQLSQTLDSIVKDLRSRQQPVGEEHAQLQSRLAELSAQQSRVESLEGVLSLHRQSETELTAKLEILIAALEEKTQLACQWPADELQSFEADVLAELNAKTPADFDCMLASNVGKLLEAWPEQKCVDPRMLGPLSERLAASLQTAIAVQLAPLSDELPDRLLAAVQSAEANRTATSNLTLPDLMREFEKFESRSLASLAARMTAGLQTAVANQLAALTDHLPDKIATAVAAVIPSAAHATANGAAMTDRDADAANSTTDPAGELRSAQLADELKRVKATLAETEALLAEALDSDLRSSSNAAAAADAREKLASAQADCIRLASELEKARLELTQAGSGSMTREHQLDHELVEALRSEVSDLRSLLAAKEHSAVLVEELRAEVSVLRATRQAADGTDANVAAADSMLREQLERATLQVVELRTQNEELAEQVAQLQASASSNSPAPSRGQEGLSWEERKRLLLQQLDAEQSDDSPDAQTKRSEVTEILRTTEAELTRRDREIAELRSLLAQQADAREGMAVGAAAVAQLIESDELVQQEREKLRTIQRSWDEKLRQAEIELSMERAKLARERLQLEEQKQQLEQELQTVTAAIQSEPNAKPADVRGHKWLSRLGLKDES